MFGESATTHTRPDSKFSSNPLASVCTPVTFPRECHCARVVGTKAIRKADRQVIIRIISIFRFREMIPEKRSRIVQVTVVRRAREGDSAGQGSLIKAKKQVDREDDCPYCSVLFRRTVSEYPHIRFLGVCANGGLSHQP